MIQKELTEMSHILFVSNILFKSKITDCLLQGRYWLLKHYIQPYFKKEKKNLTLDGFEGLMAWFCQTKLWHFHFQYFFYLIYLLKFNSIHPGLIIHVNRHFDQHAQTFECHWLFTVGADISNIFTSLLWATAHYPLVTPTPQKKKTGRAPALSLS